MSDEPRDHLDERAGLGRYGERLADAFLRRKGFDIIARNYCTPFGEIDIVALDGESLVMVEVRTRRSSDVATPESTIRSPKIHRLKRLAHCFQEETGSHDLAVRLDVVSIVLGDNQPPAIEHWVDAFADGDGA